MFRLLGNKVELVRYIVTWQETQGEETIEMEERCVSEEHKNEIEQKLTERGIPFSTESITQAGNEWFEGLEFDSYDEDLEVFNAGREAYEQRKQLQELSEQSSARGYGKDASQQDTQFSANIKGAIEAGLKIGVYWFNYCWTLVNLKKLAVRN
jgi:hypothetical protein